MAKKKIENDERGEQFRRIAPGSQMTAITPDDDTDNCPQSSTLYIGVAGDLCVLPEDNDDGDTVTIPVSDGQFIDQCTFRRVLSTGTTASNIFAVH